jgi:hypothetical protein
MLVLRFPEDDAEARHIRILTIYFNVYVCGFLGVNNKQFKMHGMYVKI